MSGVEVTPEGKPGEEKGELANTPGPLEGGGGDGEVNGGFRPVRLERADRVFPTETARKIQWSVCRRAKGTYIVDQLASCMSLEWIELRQFSYVLQLPSRSVEWAHEIQKHLPRFRGGGWG